MEFTTDESDWVFDYVMTLFRSPAWEVPIMCFIDENCASFDTGEENKFIYTDLHAQFREVVETVLCSNLAEIGLTASDFAEICERARTASDISMEVVNQILAMDDFVTFKKLMVKRNLELELEAIKALREETLEAQEAAENDVETHLMELSVLYKQEEMEQAELETAIAMSLALQEEELRLASVAAKVAEDKFNEAPEKRGLSPEQVQKQISDTKQRAAELVKRNKEALQENILKQKELQSSAEIPEDELKRREEYLRQQRDRILEKKRKEREAQLKEYHQEQKASAPEPPPELAEKLQNATPEEVKPSEADEKRNALRIALARRMKQDLLESASEEPSGGFKIQQLMELDEKMLRVEDLRRRSQERERKVHAQFVR
ncbi:hypothetical protein Poli38472_014785 [Pythium oligandrum]|uniref:Cilia- and flagella-associated protein 36 n=1 Tax=Pythium oligandrum TaxID=41045 RepID=A0A8K1CJL2_PYTOL|nr:hypothetical protein Poli38472_014785 [Pythium oligandrum]|eukprot:TMW63875.1 hypothetical protein Poli38472_014785 [Pythium oligandrum]